MKVLFNEIINHFSIRILNMSCHHFHATLRRGFSKILLCDALQCMGTIRPKKKRKELCLSFLKVKTLSAMRFFFFFFFFFLVKKGYADAEISPNFFFYCIFRQLFFFFFFFFFFLRPLRGSFLTFFSISRKKKMKKLKISQKPKKKKKKCGKFGFLKAMRVGS